MRIPLSRVFTGWPFVLSLALLVANDTWFKSAWPAWITGKLSDFAGMAMLGLLLFSQFPSRVWSCSLLLAAGFLYWKSPASDSLLSAFNALGWWNAGRTVDYTDMIAVLILPVCHSWVGHQESGSVPARLRRVLAVPVAAFTLAAMMGTSVISIQRDDSIRQGPSHPQWDRARVAEVIRAVAERQGLHCGDCSRIPEAASFVGNGAIAFRFTGEREVAFQITARMGPPLIPDFSKSGLAWIEQTRTLLKEAFAQNFPGLDYVESLSPPGPGR